MIRFLALVATVVAIALIASANPKYGLYASVIVIGLIWPRGRE